MTAKESGSETERLRAWVGRSETRREVLYPRQAAALSATLDRAGPEPKAGDPLPPLWHWVYFLDHPRLSELGPDGHARKGGFLPPVPLPRRMWAGGRLRFEGDLHLGEEVEKRSTIKDVAFKSGRSGALAFVTVLHELTGEDGGRVVEEHDIVYREAPRPGESPPVPPSAPQNPAWRREVTADAVLLFRYSALTFNGHRIHYDRDFCRDHEGYPGLVVHGPLIATVLVEEWARQRPGTRLKSLEYRARSPLFDGVPFTVQGRADGVSCRLWAARQDGRLAMEATVETG